MTKSTRRKVWFLRNGNHLCRGLFGRTVTEYGRHATWAHLGFGVLVFEGGPVTWKELLNWHEGDADEATRVRRSWDETMKENGVTDDR